MLGRVSASHRARTASTLCGDGTMATVVLNGNGEAASRTLSASMFDGDKDAWFIAGEQDGDVYRFVSFLGNINVVNVGGNTAQLEETWGMVRSAAERKQAWRPGGFQPLAVHPGSKRLYVAMHQGGAEGSHKNPAREIWVFDLKTKKRVGRLPGHDAVALTTSSNGKRLLAIDIMKLNLMAIELGAKPKSRVLTQVGDIPIQVDSN
jgi:methylamine dehydrogenase heavy chain